MQAMHAASIHNSLIRELHSLPHYSPLTAVSGAAWRVCCLHRHPVWVGSDEWDCQSQGRGAQEEEGDEGDEGDVWPLAVSPLINRDVLTR